jgi:hypothetical protein
MPDALAFEPQFIDHLAPIWRALPGGRFITSERLAPRARAHGIEPSIVDDAALRERSRPPRARVEDGPMALTASIGDIKVGRRLGYRRFAFIEHGAGQAYLAGGGMPHPSYAGGMDREDVELFMVPNEYSAALWRAAYPTARVEIVGCPRLDDLPARVGQPGRVVAISFHWPAFVAPEADSAVGFYMSVLGDLARAHEVIGHAHPKADWQDRMERIYRRHGIEMVKDFDEVCRRADVYVCDNSSTIFEFASTGRPVVVLNAPTYRRNVHHGLRFWEAATVGVQCDRPQDLNAKIDEALLDTPDARTAREAALSLVYAYRHGAARRAASAVLEWSEKVAA